MAKAIHFPSGDQSGSETPVEIAVSCLRLAAGERQQVEIRVAQKRELLAVGREARRGVAAPLRDGVRVAAVDVHHPDGRGALRVRQVGGGDGESERLLVGRERQIADAFGAVEIFDGEGALRLRERSGGDE